MRQTIIYLIVFISFVTKFLHASDTDSLRTIHVFVALCDNEHQGIVPVPSKIGNGQDPFNNLYWGAGYGVKTYFSKKSNNWKLVKTINNPTHVILQRVIFKNTESKTYLVADAYDGAEIEQATIDFLKASSGEINCKIEIDGLELPIGGGANLVAYTGHNGLMDFDIDEDFDIISYNHKDVIILACCSKSYFKEYMKKFKANPLVWSNGLMSPEAYTLKWAIDGWLVRETNKQIVDRARKAYHHYQKCGLRGSTNLLSTGF